MSGSLEHVLLEIFRNHGVSLLVAVLLFGAGVCTGMLLSAGTVSNKKLSTISSPKHAQKKAKDEQKVPVAGELSPVKLLHRIASNFLRSSAQSNPLNAIDYADSADLARNELYKLLGLTSDNQASMNVNWQHVFSNTETQFWVSSSTRSGIQLRGETFVDASACSVVNWLLQQDSVTGIEGLGGKIEVLSRTSTDNEIIIVRKMYCKAGSGIMSSKRDFKLVTSITMQDDGTCVIATRSGSWDFETASTGGGSSSNSAAGDSQRSDLSKGYIRGIVYASGFILRPIIEDDHVGCAMSFGCHVDMKGTRSGRGNTANVNLILASILRVIKCIQNGEADQFNHLDGQSLRYIDQLGSWGKTLGMSHGVPSQGELATAEPEPNENESTGDLLVKLHIPTQQLFNASLPTTADKYKLLSVARDAANRLRAQYHDTVGPDSRGVLPRTSFSGPPEIRRETFYEQDGIVLKEIHKDYVSPFGVFSATFQVQAAPEAVKKLLVFRPDSIDGFLEGRSILNYLSPETYVQWMAYGALFPLTAKDLLLVTTMEAWEKKDARSFVIASTSIDNMCEISRPVRDSISSTSGGDAGPIPKYTRANLRLGGYVGIPNEDGSTTLTFVIDMPMEAQKSSAWLMRYLAQYALTELVGRIRHAVSPFNLSVDRSLFPASHAHGAEGSNEGEDAGSPRFLGGGGTRTADLGKLLASIQRREHGATKRSHVIERVPVTHHRRDRTNSVDYYNPTDEPAGESRSRLDSDQSVGYSTWKEVRSRANSTIAQNSGDDGPGSSTSGGGGRGRGSSIEGRVPTYPQTAAYPLPPPQPSAFAQQEPSGIASGSPTRTKEKSQSTFSMLKRSLGKKSKHTKKVGTPTGASSLYMANIADEDSDYNLGTPGSTPSASPRTGQHKPFPLNSSSVPASPYEETASPGFASMVPRLRRSSRGGDEVDYDSVQRELGKISPSRRPSKTTQAMRRRSISQTEDLRNSMDGPSSTGASERASMGTAPRGHHRSQSTGDALLRLGQPANNNVLAAHLSQSMNDLPAASEKRASDELTQAAWNVYRTYFDPELCRKQLGIEWQLKLNKPNIHIYSSMVENNSWCAIKAVTIMNTTPMALVEVLLNYDRMSEYDAMFKASKLMQRVDSNTVIQRLMFKEVWPTAPRDFVVCASWRQNDDGSVSIVSRSVPDTLCAQEKGYVRGFLQVSGYLLEPYNAERPVSVPLSCASDGVLTPGQCKVTLLNHTELGGTLPASVINVLSTNAPMKILGTLSDIVSTK